MKQDATPCNVVQRCSACGRELQFVRAEPGQTIWQCVYERGRSSCMSFGRAVTIALAQPQSPEAAATALREKEGSL